MTKLTFISAFALITISMSTFASETTATTNNTKPIVSFSSGGSKSSITSDELANIVKNNKALKLSDQALGKSKSLTRKDLQSIKKKTSANLLKLRAPNKKESKSIYRDFVIYDGYSQLIEDIDNDGFYRTFSITFDADVLTNTHDDHAYVYAELYISKNGGDWIHYYTTDNFSIFGESTSDDYEVYSTLEAGFSSNSYDILIDLYEVGYSDIVATFSSEDSNALYALPLESVDYDYEQIDVVVVDSHSHGGSSSLIAICGLLLINVVKRIKRA